MKKILLCLTGVLVCLGVFSGIAAFSAYCGSFSVTNRSLSRGILAYEAESDGILLTNAEETVGTRYHFAETDTGEDTDAEYSFVLNISTKKIHTSDCPSVSKILEKNKSFSNHYEEAIQNGYMPCKLCFPEN